MKPLQQIREEYDNKFLTQVESPEEMMLGEATKSIIPSQKDMPVMLLFRRVSYRVFPGKQVVALYYSKVVDKYLSIPFGPHGNLNLSEAEMFDSIEEGSGWEAVKGAASGAWAGKSGGIPGMVTGAIVGGTAGYIKGKYDKLKMKANKEKGSESSKMATTGPSIYSGPKKSIQKMKTTGAWDRPVSSGDATTQSKLKQAELKRAKSETQPNKISDIREMLNCDGVIHEINIDGKTITLNNSMAKRILEVYDSVNTKNKKIVESLLNEDLESFKKLLNFSITK